MTQIEVRTVKEIIHDTQNISLQELSVSPYYKQWISKESLIQFLNEHRKEIDFDDELRDEFNRGVHVKEFRKDGHHLIDYICPICNKLNKIIFTGEKKFSCSCEFDKIIDSYELKIIKKECERIKAEWNKLITHKINSLNELIDENTGITNKNYRILYETMKKSFVKLNEEFEEVFEDGNKS